MPCLPVNGIGKGGIILGVDKEHIEVISNGPGVICFHRRGAVVGRFSKRVEGRAEGGGIKKGG